MQIKFKHARAINMFDEVEAKGGVTYAIQWERGMSVAKVATAVCSKHDVYCKNKGRQLASERLLNNQCVLLPASLIKRL